VIYNFAFWTENCKESYDSTWLRQIQFITDIANDPILPGSRELILTTRQGEWCEAFIRPVAAFWTLGAMPRIAPNATPSCSLEMVKTITKDKLSLLFNNPARAQEAGVGFEDFYMQLIPDPKTDKLFLREAAELKRHIQIETIELDDLHRLTGRAIVG